MKTMLIAASLAALVGAGSAAAQTQSAPTPPAKEGHDWRGAGGPGGHHFGRGDRGHRGGPGMRGGRRGAPPTQAEVEKRNAEVFARLDANKDGKATLAEYKAFIEQRRAARQEAQFKRFSNGKDSVTLADLNARAAERAKAIEARRGARPSR